MYFRFIIKICGDFYSPVKNWQTKIYLDNFKTIYVIAHYGLIEKNISHTCKSDMKPNIQIYMKGIQFS